MTRKMRLLCKPQPGYLLPIASRRIKTTSRDVSLNRMHEAPKQQVYAFLRNTVTPLPLNKSLNMYRLFLLVKGLQYFKVLDRHTWLRQHSQRCFSVN